MRGPRPSSERESKIYRIAVPALKSTQNLVISRPSCAGTAKKCTKSVMHVQSCCFAHKTHLALDVSVAVVVVVSPKVPINKMNKKQPS